MLTVNNMKDHIGRTVNMGFESLHVQVEIMDAKSAYGKIRLQVQPVAGTGTQWVEEARLAL